MLRTQECHDFQHVRRFGHTVSGHWLVCMIDTLKTMFVREFKVARFELESKFLSTKMEERTSLGDHLDRMHEMYLTLVEDYEYWTMNESTTEEFAINTLLHSLPPSYGDYAHGYFGR